MQLVPFSQAWLCQVLTPRPAYSGTASSGAAIRQEHRQQSKSHGQLSVLQKLTQQQLQQKV